MKVTLDEIEKRAKEDVAGLADNYFHYFTYVRAEFENLGVCDQLRRSGHYKQSLQLLRGVFESSLYFKLYLFGKYFHYYVNIIPQKNPNPKGRDLTLKKWNHELKQWNETKKPELSMYAHVDGFIPVEKDKIIIIYRGHFDKSDDGENGEYITHYYFIFREYQTELAFVSHLDSCLEGDYFPDITKKWQKTHKDIYKNTFSFDSIKRNLGFNKILNLSEIERVTVHYNFLSSFVHPNSRRIATIDQNNSNLLILFYQIAMGLWLLEDLANKFNELTKNKSKTLFYNLLLTYQDAISDFWFISGVAAGQSKKLLDVRKVENPKLDVNKFYYRNPLEWIERLGFR